MIEYQLKEELYNWRPDVRRPCSASSTSSEGRDSGGEWRQGQPARQLAAARPRPT